MAKTFDMTETAKSAQEQYFRATDDVPTEVWYWAAIASILASAILFASNQRHWSLFVGQWAPAFLLFGLFHKFLHSR